MTWTTGPAGPVHAAAAPVFHRTYTILEAPSPLGLKPPRAGRVPGVRLMPRALRAAGLYDALHATSAGTVRPPAYRPARDSVLGTRNTVAIAGYSAHLADRLEPLLRGGATPLVLGGDCSITIGTALALRRRGRYGIIYIDGHSDCQTPEISGTGGVAGMPLAIATGTGPAVLTGVGGAVRPLIDERDAVLIGVRDLFDVSGDTQKFVAGTCIRVHDLDAVRSAGAARIASEALTALDVRGVDGVWIHLDVDVLDPMWMPAVDSPDPGGLQPAELQVLLTTLLASPAVIGMQVTIYDPSRDAGGAAGALLTKLLAESLRPGNEVRTA